MIVKLKGFKVKDLIIKWGSGQTIYIYPK